MQFRYSEEVQKEVSGTNGLSFAIPLRVRQDPTQEMRGALRAQRDWSQFVRPVDGFNGILGGTYGFVQVTVPECLPDRVEIVSYVVEFAYLCDDLMEESAHDGRTRDMGSPSILGTFESKAFEQEMCDTKTAYNRLWNQIFQELTAIDEKRGDFFMKAWAKFIQQSTKTRDRTYQTLEEYIPACIVDTGELLWFGILTFAMGLTIPDDEHDICMELAKPAYVALSLTNDLYSWDVERKEAERSGRDYVFNSIFIIIKERLISGQDAKKVCVEEIKKHMMEFQTNMDQVGRNTALSKDLHVYMEALLYSFSGNLAWSACCARYKA